MSNTARAAPRTAWPRPLSTAVAFAVIGGLRRARTQRSPTDLSEHYRGRMHVVCEATWPRADRCRWTHPCDSRVYSFGRVSRRGLATPSASHAPERRSRLPRSSRRANCPTTTATANAGLRGLPSSLPMKKTGTDDVNQFHCPYVRARGFCTEEGIPAPPILSPVPHHVASWPYLRTTGTCIFSDPIKGRRDVRIPFRTKTPIYARRRASCTRSK